MELEYLRQAPFHDGPGDQSGATMFLQAMEHLGENPREVLVVGDRLETDIAGGQAANCRCALVLTGVSSQKMGEAWKPKIDYIVDDLETLIELL